jgi:all-trans-8'-apo-beta-carotenal 15,15'-oxygenase
VQVMRIGNFHGLMDAMYAAVKGTAVKPFQTPDDGPIEVVVSLNSTRVDIQVLAKGGYEFPSFDKRDIGRRTDHLIAMRTSRSAPPGLFAINELVSIDRRSQRLSAFDYGADHIADEHLFVPKANAAAGVGWIIGTAYNWRRQHMALSVFNAQAVADGPIARATVPRVLPPGLHGVFIGA